jgi:YesN/AraC family two-component response regulator
MCDILIIDDEPMICKGLKVALEIEGHKIMIANDGDEAMRIMEEYRPHLIITDILMPERDGIEIILLIKKQFPQIKILAISGGGRISAQSYLNDAKHLGASGVLAKPFSTEELFCEIQSLFEIEHN